VTAGHCTEAPAAYAVVFFDAGPIIPDPNFTLTTRSCTGIAGYPCGGPNSYTGAIFTHPQYDPDAFFLHALGVVVLDGAGKNPGSFGALPTLNSSDALRPGRSTTFTAVGYGLQASFPDAAAWKDIGIRQRMVAHPWLYQINTGFVGDFALLLSNNAAAGGTCFGDSGGPNFLGNSNVLAGVTSFGLNSTCAGTGGVYRVDQADDLNGSRRLASRPDRHPEHLELPRQRRGSSLCGGLLERLPLCKVGLTRRLAPGSRPGPVT
jgi:hypothetical protein